MGGGLGVEDGGHEPLLDCRVEVGSPRGERSDRLLDLFGAGVFGQVALGTGSEGFDNGSVVGVGGEDEHLGFGIGG